MALLNTIKIKVATQTNHILALWDILFSITPIHPMNPAVELWFIILKKQTWKLEDRVIYNQTEGLSSWVIEKSMGILHSNLPQSKERFSVLGQDIGSEISELNSQ